MSNQGDDCYFYFYSTCTKGDGCPFRHCEAARGSEIVCSLWQENRCFRSVCKLRHMDIKKNRKEIQCYWENQPGGCQKSHCAFYHEKPRVLDGLYVPPDKGGAVRKEKEEEAPKDNQVVPVPVTLANATNPQLRGVIKSETQESVPSPTHPPVVINPVDDEDDEDDLMSEEGDEASGVSPRKNCNFPKDDSLNFGIKTLEEIRLAKALRVNLQDAGFNGLTSRKVSDNGTEKEIEHTRSCKPPGNIRAKRGISSISDPYALKVSPEIHITDRLGKITDHDVLVNHGLKLRESLVMRLGGFVEDSTEQKSSQKSLRPVHERLGITSNLSTPNNELKPSEGIRVKTLEEIRQEKANKSQMQCTSSNETEVHETKLLSFKRKKPVVDFHVKTFSEILHEKKKLKEEKVVSENSSSPVERTEVTVNAVTIVVPIQEKEVRVKSLEEIRREKAARLQTQTQETTSEESPQSGHLPLKRRILHTRKNTLAVNRSSEKEPEDCGVVDHVSESVVANGKSGSTVPSVTVKSFDEIMREKRLRKQQEEQNACTIDPGQDTLKQTSSFLMDQPPVEARDNQGATSKNTESLKQTRVSVQQHLSIKHGAPTSEPDDESQRTLSVIETEDSTGPPPKKVSLQASDEEGMSSDLGSPNPQISLSKTSLSKASELKVRPKLNVKPSVMKPAIQLSLGQKRKAMGSQCSAVAAVKPLTANPVPKTNPQGKQTATCNMSVKASTQESVADQNTSSNKSTTPVNDVPAVSQRPAVKTPNQVNVVSAHHALAGSSSMDDDFEDLLDEFTGDRLDDESDLNSIKGEDDLLLELSEIIDS